MFHGVERNYVSKPKKQKPAKEPVMMPNLSGVKFEDALKALLKTPTPPDRKKGKK
jgi:hypothetical protein